LENGGYGTILISYLTPRILEVNNLPEAVEVAITALKDIDIPGIYQIHRDLEEALFEYMKQGNRIPIRHKFEILCRDCGEKQLNTESYYLHLRKEHNGTDQQAAIEANVPHTEYEKLIQLLSDLLEQFTDFQLEEKCYD